MEDLKVFRTMKSSRDLVFLHTDNTGKLVIMDRDTYNQMMMKTIMEVRVTEIKKVENKTTEGNGSKLILEGAWPNQRKPISKGRVTITAFTFERQDHKALPKLTP